MTVDAKVELVDRYPHGVRTQRLPASPWGCRKAPGTTVSIDGSHAARPGPETRPPGTIGSSLATATAPIQVKLAETGNGPMSHKRLLMVLIRYGLGLPRCLPDASFNCVGGTRTAAPLAPP